ncbi:MAG: PaaI family thioesterase [Actinomycetota bacterium]
MPRERLADAIRRLIEHAVVSDVPDDEVAGIAAELEAIDERLKAYPHSRFRPRELPDFNDLQATFRGDPILGEHNPLAPPVMVTRDGMNIYGRATLGAAYEGPPGYVHGAIIAGIFDMLLGMANIASGSPGMTGTLTVKYLKPTPLHTELNFEARSDRVVGRKTHTTGSLRVGDDVYAEAEALFIQIRMERAIEYLEKLKREGSV